MKLILLKIQAIIVAFGLAMWDYYKNGGNRMW
jgi:hypothetical protein